MGFWDKIFGEFIDVIDWLDDSRDTLVYRFERYNNEIKYGAKLTVRQTQVAVFVHEGKIADILTPGIYELETKNLPILSTLQHWDHGFNSPFKAEVYFCNMRRFTDLKWGTKNPVIIRDKEFKAIRVRAFGTYEIAISNPKLLIKEIVGTDGHFTLEEITSQLTNIIVSRFSTIIANANIPILDLAANYTQLSEYITKEIAPEFSEYGLSLNRVLIENISLPPKVEEILDQRTSMGLIGDLSKYLNFQIASSLTKESSNSLTNDILALGVGLDMTKNITKKGSTYIPTPYEKMYYYAKDKKPQGPYSIEEIEDKIEQGSIKSSTLIWASGMKEWQRADSLKELQELFKMFTPPPLK